MSIEFHIETRDFGRYLDIYMLDRRIDGTFILRPGIHDGTMTWTEERIEEGFARPPASIQISSRWVGPLVDALTNFTPTKIDQQILDNLASERARVDKLINHIIS